MGAEATRRTQPPSPHHAHRVSFSPPRRRHRPHHGRRVRRARLDAPRPGGGWCRTESRQPTPAGVVEASTPLLGEPRVARASSRAPRLAPPRLPPFLASSRPTPRISRHGPPGNPARGRSTSTTRLWTRTARGTEYTGLGLSAEASVDVTSRAMSSPRRRRTRRATRAGREAKTSPPPRSAPPVRKSTREVRSAPVLQAHRFSARTVSRTRPARFD